MLVDNVVARAQSDPDGARTALLAYGAEIGYPNGRLGMVFFELMGKESWERTLGLAHPAMLGLAWGALDEGRVPKSWRELDPTLAPGGVTETERAPKSAQNEKGNENVAVLQPTKSLEAGIYPAVITSIEEVTSTFDGKETQQLKIQFVVLNEDLQKTTEEIRGYTSAKWGNKCKLADWAKSILGKKCPGTDQPFDYDLLLNRKSDIQVEDVLNKTGNLVAKITKVYPFKSMSARFIEEENEEEEANY